MDRPLYLLDVYRRGVICRPPPSDGLCGRLCAHARVARCPFGQGAVPLLVARDHPRACGSRVGACSGVQVVCDTDEMRTVVAGSWRHSDRWTRDPGGRWAVDAHVGFWREVATLVVPLQHILGVGQGFR